MSHSACGKCDPKNVIAGVDETRSNIVKVAEIITIGADLLSGEIVDSNTLTIARALRHAGLDLYRTTTVGDNAGRIAQAVRESIARAAAVITTGGLGPPVDDPPREAIAL